MCGSGCGCGSVGGAPVGVPVACTLPAGAIRARLGEFEELFARALTGWKREPLLLRLEFGQGVEEQVRGLFAAEAECCAFLGFQVEGGGGEGLVVTVTAPPEAGAALDGLQGLAEGRVSTGQAASGWPR